MRKSVWAGLIAAASIIAVPAAADAGTLYLYADSNYRGLIGTRSTTGFWNVTSVNNDSLSSVRNRSSWGAAFWHDSNRQGKCWYEQPWESDAQFNWLDNDEMSSFALGRGC